MLNTKDIINALRAHLVARDSWRLSDEQHVELVRATETIVNLAVAVQVDEAAQAEERGLHTRHNCKDLAALLRSVLKLAPAEAKKRVRLTQALPGLPKTREALHAGVISGPHALVIVNTVQHLPEDRVAEAEAALADHAQRLTPNELMVVGKRIRSLVDPDGTYRDEQEGRKQRSLRMGKDQNGCLWIKAILPPDQGAMLEVALHAVSNPPPRRGREGPTHCRAAVRRRTLRTGADRHVHQEAAQ